MVTAELIIMSVFGLVSIFRVIKNKRHFEKAKFIILDIYNKLCHYSFVFGIQKSNITKLMFTF